MAARDEVGLRLRLREREPSHDRPDIDAFRPAAMQPLPSEPPPEVGVLPGPTSMRPGSPYVVFFQHAEYGIPDFDVDGGARRPDLTSWRLRPTAFGYLASVPPVRRSPARSRVGWLVAACLPLALPLPAVAAPDEGPVVQRPVEVPRLPAEAGEETDAEPDDEVEDEADEADEAEDDTEVGPQPETVGPTATTPRAPPPPPITGMPSGADQATLDAAWEGVDGYRVELELKGGRTLDGRVGAVQRDTFTLLQSKTGAILVLPKSGVVSMRVFVAPALPGQNGTGWLVGGGLLTATGSPVFVAGLSILGLCPSCASLHIPLLLVGGAALGAGIPMLVRGSRVRRKYHEAVQTRALSPVAMRTRHGWTGGIRFRF